MRNTCTDTTHWRHRRKHSHRYRYRHTYTHATHTRTRTRTHTRNTQHTTEGRRGYPLVRVLVVEDGRVRLEARDDADVVGRQVDPRHNHVRVRQTQHLRGLCVSAGRQARKRTLESIRRKVKRQSAMQTKEATRQQRTDTYTHTQLRKEAKNLVQLRHQRIAASAVGVVEEEEHIKFRLEQCLKRRRADQFPDDTCSRVNDG